LATIEDLMVEKFWHLVSSGKGRAEMAATARFVTVFRPTAKNEKIPQNSDL
jgi:hypothetical protein